MSTESIANQLRDVTNRIREGFRQTVATDFRGFLQAIESNPYLRHVVTSLVQREETYLIPLVDGFKEARPSSDDLNLTQADTFARRAALGYLVTKELLNGPWTALEMGNRFGDIGKGFTRGGSTEEGAESIRKFITVFTGATTRFPCSDPRDAIDRLSQYSIYDNPSETTFTFAPITPQTLIVDLGAVRQLGSIGADFSRHQSDRGVDSFGVFVSLDGITYTPLSVPLDNPVPPMLFNVDPSVQARYIAYYFGNCTGPNCPGSRVFKVYAIGAP